MPAPWPPPPDLDSIQQLVREADVEGLIADGAPPDEYEPEAKRVFEFLHGRPAEGIDQQTLLPELEAIWRRMFSLDDEAITQRRPRLLSLAKEIERFFGPESRPRTRGEILESAE